jgi:hypothetical protein
MQYAARSIADYAEQAVAGEKSAIGVQGGDPAKLAVALVQLAGQNEPAARFAAW